MSGPVVYENTRCYSCKSLWQLIALLFFQIAFEFGLHVSTAFILPLSFIRRTFVLEGLFQRPRHTCGCFQKE
jgi:hypothetical protein